jgi:hypothetical protein
MSKSKPDSWNDVDWAVTRERASHFHLVFGACVLFEWSVRSGSLGTVLMEPPAHSRRLHGTNLLAT